MVLSLKLLTNIYSRNSSKHVNEYKPLWRRSAGQGGGYLQEHVISRDRTAGYSVGVTPHFIQGQKDNIFITKNRL